MKSGLADQTIASTQDRRREVRARHHNGLDIVEVSDNRRQLMLMFFERVPQEISAANIRIAGPPDQPALTITTVRRVSGPDPKLRDHLVADLSHRGGAGDYRVSIVESRPDGHPGTAPLPALDPRFTTATVRFDIDEPAPVQTPARPSGPTPPPTVPTPAPSYLARDYEGLRNVLLDALTQAMPDWKERHVPDLMVALVELFAYLGDDLSYYQDAVATEAYLETARRRTSIRRHGRLVGYRFHEGCHARAWICLDVDTDGDTNCNLPLQDISFTARTPTGTKTFTPLRASLPPSYGPGETASAGKPRGAVVPMRKAHNEIEIWGWWEGTSYLPQGATSATLAERENMRQLRLQPGDVVMLEEMKGPGGGPPDETHRHVVRLTRVVPDVDPLTDKLLLRIGWDHLDALPFQLPVTTISPQGVKGCSVARANLVLAGEGRRVTETVYARRWVLGEPDLTWSCPHPDLDRVAFHQAMQLRDLYQSWRAEITRWRRDANRGVPLEPEKRDQLKRQLGEEVMAELQLDSEASSPEQRAHNDAIGLWVLLGRADEILASRRRRLAVLSRLAAASGPLSGPLMAEIRHDWGEAITRGLDPHHPASWGPAADATTQDPTHALPILALSEADGDAADSGVADSWEVTTDLVDAEPESRRVVVEMEGDRTASLRFNPDPATQPANHLTATYLVGNGAAGNVAAEAISWFEAKPGADKAVQSIRSVRNPLPATGGRDPETMDHARRAIPGAYEVNQPRALTAEDYRAIAKTMPGVRNAAAALRWTGSRLRVRVAVQPIFGEDPDPYLLGRVEYRLRLGRRIGHDIAVTAPDYRAVAIKLIADLDPYATRDATRQHIAQLLGSGDLKDGQAAFFHPSRFSFGDALNRSALTAAVQELPGVISVTVTDLRFLNPGAATKKRDSLNLAVAPTEIIRCDNDPASPHNGYAEIALVGGR